VSWKIGLSSAALRTLDQLPPRVVPAIIEFIYGPLADNPQRVGKPLRDDFTGTHSAHRGPQRREQRLIDPFGEKDVINRSVELTLSMGAPECRRAR